MTEQLRPRMYQGGTCYYCGGRLNDEGKCAVDCQSIKTRVATVENEARYLPPEWLTSEAEARQDPRLQHLETVWEVTDELGLVRGTIVDTDLNLWAPIAIVKVDPDNRSTWTLGTPDDCWRELPDDD